MSTSPAPAVGQPLDRTDGRAKVTGLARYSAEWFAPGLLYGAIVTSTVARGRLASLDASAAEQAPGVRRVFTFRNTPRVVTPPGDGPSDKVLGLLQDDLVHYDNQPIAVVVAETFEQASEAVRLVRVTYQTDKPGTDLENSLGQAQKPRKTSSDNPADVRVGDVAAAWSDPARTATRFEQVYVTPYENHNAMEPHATVAVWEGRERVTLYDATQGVHSARQRVATLLGLPPDNVRVISLFLGGGFGSKGPVWSHTVLAALCAREVGQPVKLALTRQQTFNNTGFRPACHQTIALGLDSNHLLTSLRHDTVNASSTIDEWIEHCGSATTMLYASPNIQVTHRLVDLNIGTPSYMRAPGEAPGTFPLESALDEVAYQVGLDPLELRLRNYAEKDPQSGKPFSRKALRECYQGGAERFGWAARRPQPRSMRTADGRYLVGYGVATATYPANQRDSNALARLLPDGTALVQAGTQDLGTGTYTIMTQIAADALGLPPSKVHFQLGDTRFPVTPVSGGSWTAASTGPAVEAAAVNARLKLVQAAVADPASPLHGAAEGDVAAAGGRLFLVADPARGESFAQVLGRSGVPWIEGRGSHQKVSKEESPVSLHSFGAHFVEVHVDPELGQFRVVRVVSTMDIGRTFNPKTARSQVIGGIVFGLGMAIAEETLYDARDGRLLNNNLAEYHVPVNADVPEIDVVFVPGEDPHMPLGGRGVGEIGVVGVPAAVANALYHATGVRVRRLPITPDKLLAASAPV